MSVLETQVGQIYISNKKLSKSFVCLLSEKLQMSGTEIYTLLEAPALNTGTIPEYERATKAIQAVLRKNMLSDNSNGFENAVAQINDDLSKLAEKGWAAWIGKMNACIVARQNDKLYLATTGKIHAYLLRDKQFSDIADSPPTTNPLKVFENFAAGRVAKKDFLIFTTKQLFNFISIQRLKDILGHSNLQQACQTIADIVTKIAEPDISFGTFIVEIGTDAHASVSEFSDPPASFASAPPNPEAMTPLQKYLAMAKKMLLTGWVGIKNIAQKIQKLDFSQFNKKIRSINIKDFSPTLLAKRTKEMANMEKVKQLPKMKKFFLASAIVFVIILLFNLAVAANLSSKKKKTAEIAKAFSEIQLKISDANTAYIYEDKGKAFTILKEAQAQLKKIEAPDNQEQKNQLDREITDLLNSIGGLKTTEAQVVTTNEAGGAERVRLAGNILYFISGRGDFYAPYNLRTGEFNSSLTLTGAEAAAVNVAGSDVYYADPSGNLFRVEFEGKSAMPMPVNIGSGTQNMLFYGSPAKVYALNKSQNKIVTADISKADSATNYLKENLDLSQALDIAIDGSIYVLFPDHIQKLTLGQSKPFSNTGLTYPTNSKIYANKDITLIYIMDPEAKKIILVNSNGTLRAQYTSDKFTDMKDFAISADGKSAYILNGQQLLQITF